MQHLRSLFVALLATAVLSSCGGGDASGTSASAGGGGPGAPAPTVTIAISPNRIAAGQKALMTWSSTNASTCTASGAWTLSQATSGSLTVSQANPGSYTYTLRCSSGGSASATGSVTLTVTAALLAITSQPPPNGTDYVRYNTHEVPRCNPVSFFCRCFSTPLGGRICSESGFQLTASPGVQPYSWKWAATTKFGLPPGLNLLPNGLIEGSPTTAGTYGVVVTATDSSQPSARATASYTITIRPPSPPQFQTVSTLAVGVNVPASFSFSATGGQTPLTWSETGPMPVGFSLSPGGVLSGTPTAVGSFPIKLDVQDSAGQSATPQKVNLVVTAHGFAMTGSMSTARSQHTATLLDDGTVLIAGGNNNGIAIAGSELYSGADAGFSQSGALGTARYSHTSTLLGTGQVLVTGGNDSNGLAMASAELYDPSTKTFTALGNMVSARASHTETLLGNGKVLLTGGATQSTYGIIVFMEATAELFDPATRSFAATGSMTTPRAGHTATLLSTGRVLVTGGLIADGQMTASAELYDPTTGTFTLTGAMHDARYAHTATLLANGTVLVTGGINVPPNQATNQMLTSAEIYDPKTGSFTTTGSMGTGRSFHAATLLGDASVLVVGGLDQNGDPLLGAELYSPGTGQFSLTGGLQIPSDEHTATVLRNGSVLVTGGNNSAPPGQVIVPGGNASGSLAAAELYR